MSRLYAWRWAFSCLASGCAPIGSGCSLPASARTAVLPPSRRVFTARHPPAFLTRRKGSLQLCGNRLDRRSCGNLCPLLPASNIPSSDWRNSPGTAKRWRLPCLASSGRGRGPVSDCGSGLRSFSRSSRWSRAPRWARATPRWQKRERGSPRSAASSACCSRTRRRIPPGVSRTAARWPVCSWRGRWASRPWRPSRRATWAIPLPPTPPAPASRRWSSCRNSRRAKSSWP